MRMQRAAALSLKRPSRERAILSERTLEISDASSKQIRITGRDFFRRRDGPHAPTSLEHLLGGGATHCQQRS
jgi:hypothetical protein